MTPLNPMKVAIRKTVFLWTTFYAILAVVGCFRWFLNGHEIVASALEKKESAIPFPEYESQPERLPASNPRTGQERREPAPRAKASNATPANQAAPPVPQKVKDEPAQQASFKDRLPTLALTGKAISGGRDGHGNVQVILDGNYLDASSSFGTKVLLSPDPPDRLTANSEVWVPDSKGRLAQANRAYFDNNRFVIKELADDDGGDTLPAISIHLANIQRMKGRRFHPYAARPIDLVRAELARVNELLAEQHQLSLLQVALVKIRYRKSGSDWHPELVSVVRRQLALVRDVLNDRR